MAVATVFGLLSGAVTVVGLYAHGPTVILAWSVGFTVVVLLGIVTINRAMGHNINLRVPVMVGGLVVIVLAGGLLGAGIRYATVPQAGNPAGTIAAPGSGAQVIAGEMLNASGTATDLAPGYRIDLFLKLVGVDVYYAAGDPDSTLKLVGNWWSGTIFIGGAAHCTLYLVYLSPSSVQAMNSEPAYQQSGFPSITALGIVLASVSFVSI